MGHTKEVHHEHQAAEHEDFALKYAQALHSAFAFKGTKEARHGNNSPNRLIDTLAEDRCAHCEYYEFGKRGAVCGIEGLPLPTICKK